jgi:DNA invertase Pin-like site-specific DNA recombinase
MEGLFLLGTFTEVIPGNTDPLERPEFQKAIELARSTGASLLIATLDRLSRKVSDISAYLHNPKLPSLIVADSNRSEGGTRE